VEKNGAESGFFFLHEKSVIHFGQQFCEVVEKFLKIAKVSNICTRNFHEKCNRIAGEVFPDAFGARSQKCVTVWNV